MTVRKRLEQSLINCGLWPDHAKAVVDAEIAEDKLGMKWDDPEEGYPTGLLATYDYACKRRALDELRATKPRHVAILMLEHDVEGAPDPVDLLAAEKAKDTANG